MSVTLCLTTARKQPKFDWLFSSLNNCSYKDIISQIIIVDFYAQACDEWTAHDLASRSMQVASSKTLLHTAADLTWTPPKPNVWGGKYRLTPVNWWHKATCINTALCYTQNDYVIFIDDRCVLNPTFLDAVVEAMQNSYVVCGTYEKRTNMTVVDGRILNPGETIGIDSRATVAQGRKMLCPGSWMFGCAYALPTEWMLNVNGCDESWDSVSAEDTHFGQMLENNSYPIYHDPRMALIQDRTTNEHGMKRSSKEKHSGDKTDKTHKLIEKLWGNKQAAHQWDLRTIRNQILAGGSFPIPTKPTEDWFDGQALKDMV